MQAKLKSKIAVPYGGLYQLDLPSKGFVGRGTSFNHIRDNIKEWRRANAVPIGLDFENELERELCLKFPQECSDSDPRIPSHEIRISMADAIHGTQVSIRHKLAGSPLVDQETADARAKICSACPFQGQVQFPCGSFPCGEMQNFVKGIIGSKSTKYDSQLKSCKCCHCWNSVSVWVPLDIQQSVLTEKQKDSFRYVLENYPNCWKAVGL